MRTANSSRARRLPAVLLVLGMVCFLHAQDAATRPSVKTDLKVYPEPGAMVAAFAAMLHERHVA